MFKLSTAHGLCPYDGFWIHSDELPKASFVANLKPKQRRVGLHRLPWRHFRSMQLRGVPGALKVMWGLRTPYAGAPQTRIYINPSVTGMSANDTLQVLSAIIDTPLAAKLAQLDTKVDVEGAYWRIASHVYMPYVRYDGNWEFIGTAYEGKRTRLTIYQKAGWHDEFPQLVDADDDSAHEPAITRVEIRQRLKKNRPTLLAFLRGDLVETNIMRRLRVVTNLDVLGDRVLAEEALKLGLTRALREYRTFANVTLAEVKRMKACVNDAGTLELYHLYRQQATAWHEQFIPPQ